jgi:hypothetical protein
MVLPRLGSRAVLLTGGNVLVVGNEACVAAGEPTGSERAETFDPETGQWSEVGSLNKERADPVLVALRDGQGLVLGGSNPDSQPYSSTKRYSPADRAWSEGPLMDRAGASQAVTLADGRVLAVGKARAEILADDGAWHRTTTPPSGFAPDGLVTLAGGDVLATGETDDEQGVLAMRIFDPGSEKWRGIEAPPVNRPALVALADGSVLVLADDEGGGHVLRSDLTVDRWRDAAQPAHGRTRSQITLLSDGRVLVAGGVPLASEAVEGGYSVTEGPPLTSTEIYDADADAWTAGPDLLEARQGGHAITLADESVLVFGGYKETPQAEPNPDTGTPGPCPEPLAASERLLSP